MKFNEFPWSVGRIVDLEYALMQDRDVSLKERESLLRKRDREIYLQKVAPNVGENGCVGINEWMWDQPDSRRCMLALWLDEIKRRMAGERSQTSLEPLAVIGDNEDAGAFDDGDDELPPVSGNGGQPPVFPGEVYEEALAVAKGIGIVVGIVLGSILCLSFFTYTGHRPLNVSYFLAATLLPQMVLMVTLILFFVSRKLKWGHGDGASYPLLHRGIDRLFLFLGRSLERSFSKGISNEKRVQLSASLGVLRRTRQIYGTLFFWPLFKQMQLFGMAFNGTVVCFIVFRVLFFDTAFGWQSTLQLGADAIERIVTVMALPWSWIEPGGFAVPTFDQIVGSRIILKDGIYRLATQDLISWWPFLCMAIIVYGFLPRLFLFGYGAMALRRTLRRVSFDHADCIRLIRRMTTPHIDLETKRGKEVVDILGSGNGNDNPLDKKKKEMKGDVSKSQAILPLSPCIMIVPDELHSEMCVDGLDRLMRSLHGLTVLGMVPMLMDLERIMESMGQMEAAWRSQEKMGQGSSQKIDHGTFPKPFEMPAIALLLEAWQPPIKEILDFIRSLREAVGPKRAITVVFVGKPSAKTIFTPVSEVDWEIWRMKLTALGDPWLSMEEIVDTDVLPHVNAHGRMHTEHPQS